jgi:alkyl hydroperoxide reductase subunit AhpF
MTALKVYITEDCWSCEEAVRIIADVAPLFPGVTFSMLDLETNDHPEEVFAVPTYVLNGKISFLGNPTREQLIQKLKTVQTPVTVKDQH